jgi:tetratricopeptide (TPR) repeat protein
MGECKKMAPDNTGATERDCARGIVTDTDLEDMLRQALAAHHNGDLAGSEQLCRTFLPHRPADVRVLYLLAVIATRTRRTAEALRLLATAFSVDPRSADAHRHLGDVFRSLGQPTDALESYRRSLALNASDADVLDCLAGTLYRLGRFDEALRSYERVLIMRPDDVGALNNRGNVLRQLKREDEALDSYQRALAAVPDLPDTLYNLGGSLSALKRLPEAVQVYRRAFDLRPDHAPTLNNLGGVLRDLDRPGEAVVAYDAALALRPDHAETLYNRALVLSDLGRYSEAIAGYGRALQIRGDYADAHYNRSLCYLITGDFARGWPEYEWRWQNEQFASSRRDLPIPLWLGQTPLGDKTILLHAEQGFGDTLMFCRYAKQVAAMGANVVLEVHTALSSLLQGLDDRIRVVSHGAALPRCDFRCPLLSLPLAFKTDARSIPQDIPYLHADTERAASWTRRLGQRSAPRVGIAWSGSTANPRGRHRSMTLRQFLPLIPESTQIISLQKDVRDTDVGLLASRQDIFHAGVGLADFSDTAALLASVDLVVTVDTSVAHLAAAMGKTVWILLAYNADWRWLLHRNDSPWYPTVRLFRQPAIGDWATVADDVRRELASVLNA